MEVGRGRRWHGAGDIDEVACCICTSAQGGFFGNDLGSGQIHILGIVFISSSPIAPDKCSGDRLKRKKKMPDIEDNFYSGFSTP